jgi:ribosomal protein L30/L7E
LSKFIGDEIARTLQEQKSLERRYEYLIEQRAAMKGMVNKIKYKEIQDEIQEVSRALRESTNNLVRSLKENPNISGNLIKVQRDRNELQDIMVRCVQELRDKGKYQTITFKVDEENHAKIKFQQLKSREKQLRENVAKLQETLNEEQKAFQQTTTEQKQAILQLKEELMTIKGSISTDAKFRRKESMASVSAIWREYKHKEHQLELRVKQLEEKLHIENIVNNETKEFLTRKLHALQDSIGQWESKYDNEIGEIDGNISIMNTKRNNLLEKLSALQSRRAIDVEKERLDQAAFEAETERKKAEKARKKKQNRSARAIQRAIRAYVKRKKDLEAIKNDGKKAKGGKKEKGKKK